MEKISPLYNDAVQQIKSAILESQLEAARAANKQMLSLYYAVGKFVSENSREGTWGTGAIGTISAQLQREMPGLRGFSPTSIKKMRQFYEEWNGFLNRPPTAGELENIENERKTAKIPIFALLNINRPPMAGDLDFSEFLTLSFTHHIEILGRCTSLEERAFYIHQTFINHWDKYTLRDYLKADLYHHQGKIPNNFALTLPKTLHAQKAISMFKDEYLLDFVNVEELDERNPQDIDERVVENSIVQNVKNFILTFGKDFTYVGHQVHIEKLEHDMWVDLLFYNRELQSLVVVELKKGEFKPAYLGQLSAYMRVLNDDERKANENPVIGIILCKGADKSFVEYLLQDYNQPMGVATYKVMPEKLKAVMPDEKLLLEVM